MSLLFLIIHPERFRGMTPVLIPLLATLLLLSIWGGPREWCYYQELAFFNNPANGVVILPGVRFFE